MGSEISCFQIVSTLILSGEKQPVCQQKKYPQITIRCEQTCSFNWRAYFFSLIKEKWGKSNDRVREKLLVFIGQMGRDAKQVKISIVTRCDVKKFNGPFNQKCFFFSLSPLKPFSNFCGMSHILTHFQSIWWNGHSPNSLTFSLTCPW